MECFAETAPTETAAGSVRTATVTGRVRALGPQRTAPHDDGPSAAGTVPPAVRPAVVLPTQHPRARPAGSRPTRAPSASCLLTRRLLERAAAAEDAEESRRLQDEVVVMHLGLARSVARRYRGRGISDEDLVQAACVALIKTTRTFDPEHGAEFVPYALVSMQGEVKRQFRDYGWMVRPPRPIQKLQADVLRTESELTHVLGRAPRIVEVAEHLGVQPEEVATAHTARECYAPASLDLPVGVGGCVLGELVAADDGAMGLAEARMLLRAALRTLSQTEREVVYLRYFEEQSQSEIAVTVGVTQMQVSRILSRTLAKLKTELA